MILWVDQLQLGGSATGTLVRVQPEDSWGCSHPKTRLGCVHAGVCLSLLYPVASLLALLSHGISSSRASPCDLGVSHTLVTQESHSLRSSRPPRG